MLALSIVVAFAALFAFPVVAVAESPFEPFTGQVIQNARMRGGPGKDFEVVAVLPAGTLVRVIDCDAACDWYNLEEGGWIAAFLIDCINTAPVVSSQPGLPSGLVPVQVLGVATGDTIRVLYNGVDTPVRYIGVNTPERGVALHEDATSFNAQLVEGETVYLERDVSETDGDGRLLRYVWLADGRMVNEEMIAAGFAAASAYSPDVRYEARLLAAEQVARTEKRNWWSFFPRPPS